MTTVSLENILKTLAYAIEKNKADLGIKKRINAVRQQASDSVTGWEKSVRKPKPKFLFRPAAWALARTAQWIGPTITSNPSLSPNGQLASSLGGLAEHMDKDASLFDAFSTGIDHFKYDPVFAGSVLAAICRATTKESPLEDRQKKILLQKAENLLSKEQDKAQFAGIIHRAFQGYYSSLSPAIGSETPETPQFMGSPLEKTLTERFERTIDSIPTVEGRIAAMTYETSATLLFLYVMGRPLPAGFSSEPFTAMMCKKVWENMDGVPAAHKLSILHQLIVSSQDRDMLAAAQAEFARIKGEEESRRPLPDSPRYKATKLYKPLFAATGNPAAFSRLMAQVPVRERMDMIREFLQTRKTDHHAHETDVVRILMPLAIGSFKEMPPAIHDQYVGPLLDLTAGVQYAERAKLERIADECRQRKMALVGKIRTHLKQ